MAGLPRPGSLPAFPRSLVKAPLPSPNGEVTPLQGCSNWRRIGIADRLCQVLIGATRYRAALKFNLADGFWTQVGWRYLKYDYVTAGFTNKTELNGPLVQGEVNF